MPTMFPKVRNMGLNASSIAGAVWAGDSILPFAPHRFSLSVTVDF